MAKGKFEAGRRPAKAAGRTDPYAVKNKPAAAQSKSRLWPILAAVAGVAVLVVGILIFTKAQANAFADEYIKKLNIKTASADTPIKSLSGGNQQKVILARWLLMHPEYLILDEPTRGIDVGTKVDIQKLVLELASEGMSVTFISSETDEMLRTCSRLVVMRDRKVVGELSGEDLTQNKIMSTIAGGE